MATTTNRSPYQSYIQSGTQVPPGYVTTCGQIARLIGCTTHCRVCHACPDQSLHKNYFHNIVLTARH
ncbi:MAG: MGMT family protein [Desulfuromusa sp.]|nr:MGMT family protein [Desulfuromusa sp.]